MEKFLSIDGFGSVHSLHFERGIVLAREYFSKHELDFLECYEAYQVNEGSELGQHWLAAEARANLVLYASNLYDTATLELEIVDEEGY